MPFPDRQGKAGSLQTSLCKAVTWFHQERGAYPCACSMTSGAMKHGVPQKVLRARYMRWPQLLSLRCGPASGDDAESAREPIDARAIDIDARAASTAGGAHGAFPGEPGPASCASRPAEPALRADKGLVSRHRMTT